MPNHFVPVKSMFGEMFLLLASLPVLHCWSFGEEVLPVPDGLK